MLRLYGSVLFTLWALIVSAQPNSSPISLMPITVKPNGMAPRLQFAYENDSVKIWGTNLGALPLQLRKARMANPKVRLNMPLTLDKATTSMELNYAYQRDTSYGFKGKRIGQSYYGVLKKSFLSGKGSAPIFINQNISLGGFLAPPTWPTNFKFTVKKIGTYRVHYVPATTLNALPVFDGWSCTDASGSYYKLRALQGYGLDKIPYKPYQARKRERVAKAFEIFFESNSTQPKPEEISVITTYLEQNQFEIVNAVMTGGSSIEGDENRNKQLQRERARVISNALARYNKSAIKKDTILLNDNWPKFREQVRASKYGWLDSLSNEKIRDTINRDQKLRKGLENVLRGERKASLSLTMVKILSADEQFIHLKKQLDVWFRVLVNSKQSNQEIEAQIMGAMAYLFDMRSENVLSHQDVNSLLLGNYQDLKSLYLGLHIIKQFNEGKFGPEDKMGWKQKWVDLELEPWIVEAQHSLVRVAASLSKTNQVKYLKMQADFQSLAFKLISLDILDVSFLCLLNYPEKNEYISLLLNKHAFMFELYNERGLVADCAGKGILGLGDRNLTLDSARHTFQQDSIAGYNPVNRDSLMLRVEKGLPRAAFKERRFVKPTSGNTPKGEYYFMLKQGFVNGNRNVLTNVDGNLSLNAFSLYHLLKVNVINWKPELNYFYDKEVRLEEMDKLISILKKGNPICEPIINGFYLEYHRKALRYLELYFEPSSARHKEIAENSLKYITDYYKKRINRLRGDLPLKLAMYLNTYNWFPGRYEGAWFGYDLFNTILKNRKLTTEEERLWMTYVKIYNPDFKVGLPAGYTKERVLATAPY